MEDWRYENLREDIKRLREEIRDMESRTYKVETWQSLLPFRVWLTICWLTIVGVWIFVIAEALGRS